MDANKAKDLRSALKENSKGNSKDYFSLSDDGDKATVVFLHGNDPDTDEGWELDWGRVYEVKLPIKGENRSIKKYVEVIDPATDPLALNGWKTQVRALFQLVEVSTNAETKEVTYGDVKVWDRGPSHINTLLTYMTEIGPLHTYPIQIKRNGAKGDQKTKYEMMPRPDKPTDVNTLPKPTNLTKEGKYILTLTPEEMQQIVDGKYVLPSFNDDDKKETTYGKPSSETKVPKASTPPPIPVLNPKTGQWEIPAPVVKKPVVNESPPVPVLNPVTGLWELPNTAGSSVAPVEPTKTVADTKAPIKDEEVF